MCRSICAPSSTLEAAPPKGYAPAICEIDLFISCALHAHMLANSHTPFQTGICLYWRSHLFAATHTEGGASSFPHSAPSGPNWTLCTTDSSTFSIAFISLPIRSAIELLCALMEASISSAHCVVYKLR